MIRVEALKITTMTRSAKDTETSRGGMSAEGRAQPGHPQFRVGAAGRRLEDKAAGRVEKVSPAYTSQRCSACGHVARSRRESQALFRCIACGFAGNADVNAARNIAAGHAVTARGGDRVTGRVTANLNLSSFRQ